MIGITRPAPSSVKVSARRGNRYGRILPSQDEGRRNSRLVCTGIDVFLQVLYYVNEG